MISTKKVLIKYLDEFSKYTRGEIFERRKDKFLNIGKQKTFSIFSQQPQWIKKKGFLINFKSKIVILSLVILMFFLYLLLF